MVATLGFHLEPIQLERLKEHQYKSQGISLFEPVMQVFWRWLVTKVPMWLAPNLITFIGLLVNILTTLPVVLLDSNCEGLAPSWSYLGCAVGFFIYQSLDAIDGKQARRTGTSSPLGELFDHGCDTISIFLVLLSALSALATHQFPLIMLGFSLLLMVLSFCYHWQTYVSGVLYFKKIDVTEAQFLHMFLLVMVGVFGPQIWHHQIPYLDLNLRLVVMLVSYGTSIINALVAVYIIFTSGVGKNGSTVADTSVLSPVLIPMFQVAVVVLYALFSPTPLEHYCMLFFTATIFPLVKSTLHIIVASMTKSPLPLLDPILLGPLLALANVYCGCYVPEKYMLAAVAVYNVTDVSIMCVSLCKQICEFLDVSCFTIPHQPAANKKDTT